MAVWRCRDCRAGYGAWLSSCPRCRSGKGLVVALNACGDCTTKFAVGLLKCPHCGSTEYEEDGTVPKISRHGGPSDKTLPAPDHAVVVLEPLTTAEVEELREAVQAGTDPLPFSATVHSATPENEGGELSSPGISSSASSPKPPTSSEQSKPDPRSRARTTASRSGRGRTDSSTARLTDGEETAPTSGTDSGR